MKEIDNTSKYASFHSKRYKKTVDFMNKLDIVPTKILDLGPENPMGNLLKEKGFDVTNSGMIDLDLEYNIVKKDEFELVTAFEIVEHLVSPFPMLKAIAAKKLLLSVPLRLWFAPAYWSEDDPYDRHYHEFEPRQLEMLLDKAGWKIIKQEQWKSYSAPIGIRPILRRFVPRHIIVYCERADD